jgi:hypothetical protein
MDSDPGGPKTYATLCQREKNQEQWSVKKEHEENYRGLTKEAYYRSIIINDSVNKG